MGIQQLHNSALHNGLVVAVIAYTIFVIVILSIAGDNSSSQITSGITVFALIVGIGSTFVSGLIAVFGEGKKYVDCGLPESAPVLVEQDYV